MIGILDTRVVNTIAELNVPYRDTCTINSSTGQPYYDDDFSDINDPNFGHGTAVASQVATADDLGGFVGVAPGDRVYSIKVVAGANSTYPASGDPHLSAGEYALVCGLDKAAATRTDGDPYNNIWTVNMSLGWINATYGRDDGNCGNTNGDGLHKAICRARDSGLVLVAAAHNMCSDFGTQYRSPAVCTGTLLSTAGVRPAMFDEVLTVTGAVDTDGKGGHLGAACGDGQTDDHYAGYSNWAVSTADKNHTIAGPVCTNFLERNGSVGCCFIGTSTAAPHAAGVVQLCFFGTQWNTRCNGQTEANVIYNIRYDAQTYSTNNPSFRFTGDPFTPVTGRYYGYLVEAATY